MHIKIALYDEKAKENIIKCCEEQGVIFMPILRNIFAMLTEDSTIIRGREDGNNSQNMAINSFVKIYKCTKNKQKKKFPWFGTKELIPYNGKILDNLFFKKIIEYSLSDEKDTEIESIEYKSNYNSESNEHEIDEIKKILNDIENIRITKFSFCFQDIDIIINKDGYIDLDCDMEDYQKHENKIVKIIKMGLED
jgi:hypothetical protein